MYVVSLCFLICFVLVWGTLAVCMLSLLIRAWASLAILFICMWLFGSDTLKLGHFLFIVCNMQNFSNSEECMVKTYKFLFWILSYFWTSLNLSKTVNSHSLCCGHAWRWTAFWSSQAFWHVWALCGAVPESSV